jgi:hypothetical protein
MPDQVARNVLAARTFLDQSVTAFAESFSRGGPSSISTVVWITRPNDFRDCLYFWNLRALRSLRPPQPMLLLPHNEVQHWLEFARDFATVLARPNRFAPDVVIGSLGVPEVRLREIASLLGLEPSVREPKAGIGWQGSVRTSPFDYLTNSVMNPAQAFVFERRYGAVIEAEAHVFSGKASLRFPTPVRFLDIGKTLIELRSPIFDGLPQRDELAEYIIRGGIWRHGGIQFGAVAMSSDYWYEIQVPTLGEAVDVVLRACTSEYVLSDKGKLASSLVSDANLDVLLEPNIYEAIRKLQTPRSTAFKKALKLEQRKGTPKQEILEFAELWGGRSERSYQTATNLGLPDGGAVTALERLCALGWAERGLSIRCERCLVQSFVPMNATTGPALCPGCGSNQSYKSDKKNKAESLAIYYRLNSFVDRASDQGVLPHLLVMAALKLRKKKSWLLPGVNIEFPDSQLFEVDVVGVFGGKVLAGEVKSRPQDFSPKQIKRDVELSKRLTADVHVMASVDHIPEEAIAMAQEAADRAGLELLILTRDDLRPRLS